MPRRVFYAWEIGQDLGHVSRFAPIGMELRKNDILLSYALTDLSRCSYLNAGLNDYIYQAPCCTAQRGQSRDNLSYPQTLINHGFLDPSILASRMTAWVRLFEIDKPDVVVCDFAPVAQIAAQSIGIPTVMLGTSFECPPPENPMPPFTAVVPHLQPAIFEDQRLVDNSIAVACGLVGFRGISLAEIVHNSRRVFLCTYPELDCYGPHRDVAYFGSWSVSSGSTSSFTSRCTAKIFCYLKFQPGVEFLVGSLQGFDVEALVFIDGAPKEFVEWFSSPNIRFLDGPADIAVLAPEMSLAVTNGNHGTTSLILSYGIPVLMMPLHIEQSVHAKRVQMAGLGVAMDPSRICDFAKIVKGMLADSELKRLAVEFSNRSQKYRQATSKIAAGILSSV